MLSSITILIDAHIASSERKHAPSESIYATDLGSCLRKVTMRRAGFKSDPYDARTLRVFKVGNMYHDFITDALEAQGVLVAKEVVGKKDNISLRVDAIIKGGILVEIKSVNSRKFSYLKSDSDPHYLMQTAIGFHILKDEYKLTSARLYYVSKDDLRILEMEVDLPKWLPRALTYVIDLNNAWKKWTDFGQMPSLLPDVGGKRPWHCRYCNMLTSCKDFREKMENGKDQRPSP